MTIWSWLGQHRGWSISAGVVSLLLVGLVAVYLAVFCTTSTPLDIRQAVRLYRARQARATGPHVAGMPQSGVYEYDTTGHEALSIVGASRTFPDRSPMIVTGRGCATVRWEPMTEHVEEFQECAASGGGLVLRSTTTIEEIAGITTRSVITCPTGTYLRPPTPTVGARWTSTCHSGSQQVRASGSVLGRADLHIGGFTVPAWHTELTFRFSGAVTGTSPSEYWFAIPSDLLLRQTESVHIAQRVGPLGAVRYTENMSTTLRSVVPLR